MTRRAPLNPCPARAAALGVWLAASLGGLSGCLEPADEPGVVTVATAWPAPARAAAAAAHRGRVRWVVLAPGDDLTRVARRRRPPDVLLGGPAASYQALERAGLLEPDPVGEGQGGPAWRVARSVPMGFAVDRNTTPALPADQTPETPVPLGGLTFDDPRADPAALFWAGSELAGGPWGERYARLVRAAGNPRRIVRAPGAALAAVERGEMTAAPSPSPWDSWGSADGPLEFVAGQGPAWVEGVAVPRHAPRPGLGRAFVRDLAAQGLTGVPDTDGPDADLGTGAGADGLLADLLGATLVDAQDELRAAWDALDRAGHPGRSSRWLTAPPPWPPASVVRIVEREPNSMALLETLAAQVAPEADVRAWLLRSWLAPSRPVDGAFLGALAGAADGKLAREPRFRAWLRGEWTAWARQRYRRVARLAETEGGVP